MRKIKYRAWLHRRKRMVDVLVLYFGTQEDKQGILAIDVFKDDANGALPCSIDSEYLSRDDEEEFTVMRDLGLRDKNKKRIFQGDILRFYSKSGENRGFGGITLSGDYDFVYEESEREVIGNIFENPELLKG